MWMQVVIVAQCFVILVQIQEPALCATHVPVIARQVAPTPEQLMSVLVVHQGRDQPPVSRQRPTPSWLYWKLRTPRLLSVWLSGWSELGVGRVDSILHKYDCRIYSELVLGCALLHGSLTLREITNRNGLHVHVTSFQGFFWCVSQKAKQK